MAAMNKRKREAHDIAGGRPAPAAINQMGNEFEQHYLQTDDDGMGTSSTGLDFSAALVDNTATQNKGDMRAQTGDGHNVSDTAAAAIAQYHTMTVPQPTEQTFLASTSEADLKEQREMQERFDSYMAGNRPLDRRTSPAGDESPNGGASTSNRFAPKPAVGTDEWHKIRKDNHKEVERRRRETINEGINELAKIVPGCEKNKGSILQRAVQFITQLKENETQNIEKWTLEKLLTEQAIAELSSSCDKLKAECQRAWNECEGWKKAAQKAGVGIDSGDKADADGEDAD